MKFGLFGINTGSLAREPARAVAVARAIEAAGWESVWTGEHYALPDPPTPDSPAPPETPMLDPFVTLAHLAAATSTLKLGTGVTVVPLYRPFALAKQVASLDRVSGGRFLFGIGVGYLAPEFDAFDVPLAGRGERTDEMLDALAAIWAGDAPVEAFGGRTFAGVRAAPPPQQPQGPPIHVGGYAPASFRRAVTRGAGWYGFSLDVEAAERAIAALRDTEARIERPAGLGTLEITITPPPSAAVDGELIERYALLGVDRLALLRRGDLAGDAAAVAEHAARLAALA